MTGNDSSGSIPHRIVDSQQQGWLSRGDGVYEGYDPTVELGEGRLEARPLEEIEAEFGSWRPVVRPADEERAELRSAIETAGRLAIGSIASALDVIYHEASTRVSPSYAHRTLTAGRPGSWEAAAVLDGVYVGTRLNLAPDATGPDARVHLDARDRIAAVLRAWTSSEDRYTEVPATLAGVVADYADEHGADGWSAIADDGLQPGTPDGSRAYALLYNGSVHFDPEAIM